MTDLVVVVPSRGRPAAAMQLAQSFASHCRDDSRLMLAVGEDDPTLPDYSDVPRTWAHVDLFIADPCDRPSTMNHALNQAARALVDGPDAPFAVGFCGDDHRPRTVAWDHSYLAALRELGTGIVYGDDRFQGQRLPTQWAMTSDIVRELGQMTPRALFHMYIDDYIRDLGRGADCIRYLPDVVVEHMHPLAGKATVDESYLRSNSAPVYGHDERIYGQYKAAGRLAADVEKVKALRAAAAG